jgi:hypothetical protein
MKKVFMIGITSVASLVILRTFGIQTDILVVDDLVETVMAVLNV